MRFDVITLFAQLFQPFLQCGVTQRAFEQRLVDVHLWNLRDFAQGNYRRVDDRPFGGGPGMVLMAQPLLDCLSRIRQQRADAPPVLLFTPVGERLDHAGVQRWSASAGAVLICGRYEGIDQRFIDSEVTHCLSLGDFVLSGGEIAAMALLDAVARLQPGVLQGQGSCQQDSFNPDIDGLLDCPHYTRPPLWQERTVPEVLLSGHHPQIAQWRREQRLLLTARQRPELLGQARADGRLSPSDEAVLLRYPSAKA